MFRLALANLVQNRTRLLISVAGVGLAMTMVLFFNAMFAGAESRLTVYIDNAGADVWVSQAGVRTMHMSESALPARVVDQVKAVAGVAQAEPILYSEAMISANGKERIAYVFGVRSGAPMGKPWHVREGASMPDSGEIILDRAIASQMGVGLGDNVTVVGQRMRIAGLMSGTSSVASSVSFITFDDFAKARGEGQVISFVLVKASPGAAPSDLALRIDRRVPAVTAQTREQFAAEERQLVKDMSTDMISIMNTASYVVGLAVVVLTIYIATVARRKEYGVLKALGVGNLRLFEIVVVQALLTMAAGLIAGLGLTMLASVVIPRFNELIVLSVTTSSLFRVALTSTVLAGAAALLPAQQLARLEPVAIIRRG